MKVFSGCFTALVTPMKKTCEVDYESLQRLVEFQVREGVQGILAVGTTGECATLTWDEHVKVIEKIHEGINERCETIGGTGSNCTEEVINASKSAWDFGVKSLLLVDPYYNGPSSIEIRKEYIEPVAKRFPEAEIIPYVIPGRTGTQLLPQDLAILHSEYKNVNTVKEATGNLENMKLTRKFCGKNFNILSGDDDKTYQMMTSPEIMSKGVVSVASNVVPNAVQNMVQSILDGDLDEAAKLTKALKPMFRIVTVKTEEETPFGPMICKARNPLPYKTLMNILGMSTGPCKQPLGKMTRKGVETILNEVKAVYVNNPEILQPIEDFFDVDMSNRLYEEKFWKEYFYD